MEIVSVRPAEVPMRIAIIVSDAGTGGFQHGLANFMQKLLGHAEFSLISVIVQPETVVDYHPAKRACSRRACVASGPRGRPQRGAQLMETIQEATKRVRDDGTRPVILVAAGRRRGDHDRSRRRRCANSCGRAAPSCTSCPRSARNAPHRIAARAPASPREQAQMQDAEDADGALNLAQVLGDGSKESGGRHDQVISTTLVPALERVADELLNQYAITYVLPDGVKAERQAVASTKRKGASQR